MGKDVSHNRSAMAPAESLQQPPPEHREIVLGIYLQHEPTLRAILYRYTRNCADVDEFMQDIFIRLLLMKSLDMRVTRAYLIAIAHNIARDTLRHLKVMPIEYVGQQLDDALFEEQMADPCEELQSEEGIAELMAAVDAVVPPKARQVFILRKVYGFSQKVVAERLGISVSTVEQHLSRAARRLGLALGGDERAYGIGRRRPADVMADGA
jgi:RNA polymerase sigma factor (sigma-70 family)